MTDYFTELLWVIGDTLRICQRILRRARREDLFWTHTGTAIADAITEDDMDYA